MDSLKYPGTAAADTGAALFPESTAEDDTFLSQQLITYIGNKRRLLGFIGQALDKVARRLNRPKLRLADVFSGSGAVSRYCKRFAELLVVNDLEDYAAVVNRCYLANRGSLDLNRLADAHRGLLERLAADSRRPGFIRELYAPADDRAIIAGERVFYTVENAAFLDSARQYIAELSPELQPFFLGPLLSEASIHANTAGVFKGFYKNKHSGVGQFGGAQGDALGRITGRVKLPFPLFSRHDCALSLHQLDANQLASSLPELDLAYLDPPYNQHPYGSNYFMLNLLTSYRRPATISRVSGIPDDWRRSDYNRPQASRQALARLVADLPAKYLLVSFNSDGFIKRPEMLRLLETVGRVEVMEIRYNAFRGSRNLAGRDLHVSEFLYLVEKR